MSKKHHKSKKNKQRSKPHSEHKESHFFAKAGSFLRNGNVHFIVGLVIAFAALYFGIAALSFFFTGEADQSIVNNKGLTEIISKKAELKNWAGNFGAYSADFIINRWFGVPSFLLLFLLGSIGFKLMRICKINLLRRFLLYSLATILASVTLAYLCSLFCDNPHYYIGGLHGYTLAAFLETNLGKAGLGIALLTGLLLLLIFISSSIVGWLQNKLGFGKISTPSFLSRLTAKKEPTQPDEPDDVEDDDDDDDDETDDYDDYDDKDEPDDYDDRNEPDDEYNRENHETGEPKQPEDGTFIIDKPTPEPVYDGSELGQYDPRLDLSSYRFPDISLLKKYETNDNVDKDEMNENRTLIQQTLADFGITIVSIKATVGPTITLYEVIQDKGIRISKIRSLSDDIAQSLKAKGIRIIAPMPGKNTVGIEVPNKNPQIVSMESVITSRRFAESKFELPIVLGRTIINEVFMFDLTKMPHLLVAGTTGKGKSVGLNAIITSLLYKKHPAELKFVLVDPKVVELSIYESLERHYLAKLEDMEKAIITDTDKVLETLKSLCREMDDRYALLSKAHVRNITEYNERFKDRKLNPLNGHKFLPYIVVVIDEFGDLIMTARKEIEIPIARIAQKARAVGIHMIIATQRPSANIITGVIKANFPARIAFGVTSGVESRVILDSGGADKLVGRGDLLFSQGGDEQIRMQCAYLETDEIKGIVEFIGSQAGYTTAYTLPEPVDETQEGGGAGGAADLSNRDALFDDVARMVVATQNGSTSNIQRKFSIGYNKAGKIMDQLELAGVVGANDGSKGRPVLVPDEAALERLLLRLQNA